MGTIELIQQEVSSLPEEKAREVLDFAKFLKTQMKKEEIRAYLHQELAEIDAGEAEMISMEEFEASMEEVISRYED